jgi:hypothetical protein
VRKLLAVALLSLLSATAAVADQINFNFTLGGPNSVSATAAAGLTSGPSMLTSISDSTTSVNIPFSGTYVNGNTGPATSLTMVGSLVIGAFAAGGANSVIVEDSMGNVIVAGDMEANSALLSAISVGTGSFLGTFHVTFVDPAVLALFGPHFGFQNQGSVAFTIGSTAFDGTTFTGNIGGGAVTIQTTLTSVPEPVGLGVLGMGLLTIAEGLRRWRAAKPSTTNSL